MQSVLQTLTGLSREGVIVLLAPSFYLGEQTAAGWPPAGGVILKAPKTSVVGYSICSAAASDNSSRLTGTGSSAGRAVVQPGGPTSIGGTDLVAFGQPPQEQLVAAVLAKSSSLSASPLRTMEACQALQFTTLNATFTSSSNHSTDGPLQRLLHLPMLDLGMIRQAFVLQPATAGNVSILDMQSITLLGLSQGPAVAAAAELAAATAGSNKGRLLLMQQHQQQSALQANCRQGDCHQAGLPGSHVANRVVHVGPSSLLHMQQMQLQHVHRQLLAEIAASGSLTQSIPDVWAHLVWAVRRDEGGLLNLTLVQLVIPRPEFQTLLDASKTTADGSFSIPLQGNVGMFVGASCNRSSSWCFV
jgi:hypothetical protein